MPLTPDQEPAPGADEEKDAQWEREAWARAQTAQPEAPLLSVRGEDAVWAHDAPALTQALAEGWTLPVFRQGTARGHDLGLVFTTISTGWLEGWRLLRTRWPELSDNDQLLLTALASARPAIIDDILTVSPRGGIDRSPEPKPARSGPMSGLTRLDLFKSPELPDAPDHAPLLLFHELFSTMTRDIGDPVEPEVILACARVLSEHGADPTVPYPGAFEEGDRALAGNTLWSLAVREHKWEIARGLAPPDFATLQAHPRWREAMDEWFECAWLGHHALLHVFPPSQLAQAGWLATIAPMAADWLSASDYLLRPSGWPALKAMTPQQRAPIWEHLLAITEMNGLNWIALGADEDLDGAYGLLDLIQTEVADPNRLHTAWTQAAVGARPCEVWARQTGQPASTQWPTRAR